MDKSTIKKTAKKILLATNYSHHTEKFIDAKQKKHLNLVNGLIFKEREGEWLQERGFVKNGILSKKNLTYLLDCLKFLEAGNSFEELKKQIITDKPVSKEQIVILKRILYFSKKGPEFFEYFYKSDGHRMPHISKFFQIEELLERLKTENCIYKVNEEIRLGIYKPPKKVKKNIEIESPKDETTKENLKSEETKKVENCTKHHYKKENEIQQ